MCINMFKRQLTVLLFSVTPTAAVSAAGAIATARGLSRAFVFNEVHDNERDDRQNDRSYRYRSSVGCNEFKHGITPNF